MKRMRWAVSAALVGLTAAGGFAQERGGGRRGRGGEGEQMRPMMSAADEALEALLSNATVAAEIGLTDEQNAALKDKLSADAVRTAAAARQLADFAVSVLTDPDVAADLGLTEAQQDAVKEKLTAALVKRALSAEQIGSLANAVSAGVRMGAMQRAMGERFRQFDRDGDGRLSDEERDAMRQSWGRGREGGLSERMKQYDKDGDGTLSAEEREAARQAAGR